MKGNKLWITLVELIVWLTTSMFILMGLGYLYSEISKNNWNLNYVSESYWALSEFSDLLTQAKKSYPNIRRIYSETPNFERLYWFDLIILASDDNSSGLLVWAYDTESNQIVYNSPYYSDFNLFYMFLDSSQIVSAINDDVNTFLTNVESTSVTKISWFELLRLSWSHINSPSNILKIDFVYTPNFYESFSMEDLKNVANSNDIKKYSFSLVR